MRKLYLLTLLLTLALTSCKEAEGPAPQPELKLPAVTFNFRYDLVPYEAEEFELIVSQKDGKVLLDTLIAPRVRHELVVESEETKFDVTTIYLDPTSKKYSMRTYVQVNPHNWHVTDYFGFYTGGASEACEIKFTNVPPPVVSSYHLFKGKNPGGQTSNGWDDEGNLVIGYNRFLPADTVYLLMTQVGKYIFAPVTSELTEIDFSEAKPVVEHRLNVPAGMAWQGYSLDGYLSKGNYIHGLLIDFGLGEEVQYPSTLIEEYLLTVDYYDAEGCWHKYHHIGESVPTDLGYLTESDFAIAKAEFNDFQIRFKEDMPTSYYMEWGSEELKVNWRIYLAPEQTTFKPQDYLQSLSVGYLKGMDLSGFTLKDLTSYQADKTKNYTFQSLHDYLNNPEAVLKHEMRQYRTIQKIFR
ncbi:hypothetical protein DXT99_25915 [Pontibacter diazotrophicus]|uniref:Uncharacterized protein n=1 Tax=Pontibacter diazotrophicus TaxID=1400979 RepID=A0A3D8L0K1_9BACT|nr:hypothetical protein [Pontibacter diazotrophicus]RDV10747.1 hypothetical protein DXT99_25915 [Pontibacter diazotrophicus]